MIKPMTVYGTDLSRYQQKVDLKLAKKQGLQWVYAKATEGTTVEDPMYSRHRASAKAAGLPFGAYHFARPDRDGKDAVAEARKFLSVAKIDKKNDLLPMLDFEDRGGLNALQVERWINTFCAEVKRAVGVDPIIYLPSTWGIGSAARGRIIWRARYNNNNRPPVLKWDIWQFSNGILGNPRTFPGLGNVDLNTMRDGLRTLDLMITKTKPASGARVPTLHTSLQFSDTPAQKEKDVKKIFARAVKMGAWWVTGTESGESPLKEIVAREAKAAGYKLHRNRGNWIAVRRSVIKRGTWEEGVVFVESTENVVGPGHDLAFPWVTFEHVDFQVGQISVAAIHYATKGRNASMPNFAANKKYAAALDKWGREKAKGKALAFVQGDFNMLDNVSDLFFGGGFTTYGDQLKKWPNTGHGPIDALATWDGDGRVTVVSYDAWDDKEFFMNSDHFVITGTARIKLIK